MRKYLLVDEEIYHIFTRSIAEYIVFNDENDFERIRQLIKYYTMVNNTKYSDFISSSLVGKEGFYRAFDIVQKDKEKLVQIIAYCIMPTHIHLVLKQLAKNGISKFSKNIFDSYSRYFNIRHGRKGPLWEGKFKNVLVDSNEQLLHVIRYVHLNPVTAKLTEAPDGWPYSSHREYIGKGDNTPVICSYNDIVDIEPTYFNRFVCDQISYQRELADIKNLILE